MWKRVWKFISGILTGGIWILVLPVAVQEGKEGWERWLGTPLKDAMNILYQQFGWPSVFIAIAATLSWWFYWYPPKFLRYLRHYCIRLAQGTRPMQGIPELERCHQEFIKYIQTPYEYPVGQREIAATQAFLPYLKDLCRILDEQNIPHPPLPHPRELTFTGTGKWGDFLSSLWATRHDIEKARKVYQASEFDNNP